MAKNITYESAGPASIGTISDSVKIPKINCTYSWQTVLIKGLVYLALLGGILYIVKIAYLWYSNSEKNTKPVMYMGSDSSGNNYNGYNIPNISRNDTADSSSLQSVPGTRYTYLEENVF